MPRKKAQSPNEEDEAATVSPARRVTRQTRAQSHAAGQSAKDSKLGNSKGSYQPSAVPRRGAPERPRSQSVQSVATEDFAPSSYVEQTSPRDEHELAQSEDENNDEDDEDELHESVDEVDEDELQEIIDWTLPDLSRWSRKTYDTVAKSEAGPSDKIPWNRLATIEKEFDVLRPKMTSSASIFIHPNQWHATMMGITKTDHLNAALKRVVEANIALLLKLILQISHEKVEAQPVLQELNSVFPALFRLGPGQEQPKLTSAEYEKQYGIKCLMLAFNITNDKHTSPTILAADVFCDKDTFTKGPRRDKAAKAMLLDGPYDNFDGSFAEAGSAITEQHQRNMVALCDSLAHRNRAEVAKTLEHEYPVERLLKDMSQWARQSYQSLQALPVLGGEMSQQGLVPSVQPSPGPNQDQPASTVASKEPSQPAVEQMYDIQPSGSSEEGEGLFVKSSQAESVRREEQSAPEQEQSGSDSEPDEPIVRTGQPTGSYLDGSATLGLWPDTNETRTRVAPPSNQQAVRNPLADLNAADIVSSYRAEGSANGRGSSQAAASRGYVNGRKRSALYEESGGDAGENVDEDEDEDDPFQTDPRPLNESRRAVVTSRRSSGPPSKRVRPLDGPAVVPSSSRRSVANPIGNYHESQELQPSDIDALSQRAREATRIAARERQVRRPRSPQRRERWSTEDSSTLLKLIAENGCVWSTLEEVAKFDVWRSQQQIRDKARNMKVDFLKADLPLPVNFDGVALGKKEIDALKRMGKNPMRKEDDWSSEGVTNNKWVDETEHNERPRRSQSERSS